MTTPPSAALLDARFGLWREILQRAPSPEAWRALCHEARRAHHLDPARFADAWIPYAEGILARWPDGLRVADDPLRDLLLKQPKLPIGRLVRGVAAVTIEQVRTIRRRLPWVHIHTFAPRRPIALKDLGPTLAGVRTLRLPAHGHLGDALAAHIAAHPEVFGALEALDLRGCHLSAVGASALAGSPHLSGLRVLRLGSCGSVWPPDKNPLGDEGAEALASSPHLASLERLDLEGCLITHQGVAALANSPHLDALGELILCAQVQPSAPEALQGLEDDAIEALASGAHLARLERLGLSYGVFSADVLERLLGHSRLGAQLRALKLSGHPDGEGVLLAMAEASRAQVIELREVFLSFARLSGPDGLDLVAASPLGDQLERLEIKGAPEAACEALGRSRRFPALRELVLTYARPSDRTLGAVLAALPAARLKLDEDPRREFVHARHGETVRCSQGRAVGFMRSVHDDLGLSPTPKRVVVNSVIVPLVELEHWARDAAFWARVEHLVFRYAHLSDDHARVLAQCPHLGALRVLEVWYSYGLGEAGLEALCQSPNLSRLRALVVRGARSVPPDVAARLRTAAPFKLHLS